MNWQTKMIICGWRYYSDGSYRYKHKIKGRVLAIPAHAAKTWETWGLVPTLQGVQRV